MSDFFMPSNHTHHLYKQAHPLIRKILELEIEKRLFAKKYPNLFSELLIFRDKFSSELKNWLFAYYLRCAEANEKNHEIDQKTKEKAIHDYINEVFNIIKIDELSITYLQINDLQISKENLETYYINEKLFRDFLTPYADDFKKIFSAHSGESPEINLLEKYNFTDLLSNNCLLNFLRDVIDISLTYPYLTEAKLGLNQELLISHMKMFLLYKYHSPLGMNNLQSYMETMQFTEDDKNHTSSLMIQITVDANPINWSELLSQIMFKYLDQKIRLDKLNTSNYNDYKASFLGSREHKEIFNILDQLDALNNAKATSDRYDSFIKNLICLIIYDLEITCPENLINRVMEKLMSLDDLCPNYSRFQFNSDPINNFDGREIPSEYKEYYQPLKLKEAPKKKELLKKIILQVPYKLPESKTMTEVPFYTIKRNYIMDEYKKFKLKFFK